MEGGGGPSSSTAHQQASQRVASAGVKSCRGAWCAQVRFSTTNLAVPFQPCWQHVRVWHSLLHAAYAQSAMGWLDRAQHTPHGQVPKAAVACRVAQSRCSPIALPCVHTALERRACLQALVALGPRWHPQNRGPGR